MYAMRDGSCSASKQGKQVAVLAKQREKYQYNNGMWTLDKAAALPTREYCTCYALYRGQREAASPIPAPPQSIAPASFPSLSTAQARTAIHVIAAYFSGFSFGV